MTKHSVPKTTGGTTGSKQRVSWAGRGAAISWRRRLAKSLQPTHWPTLSQGASASASGMPSLTATPCDSESENLFAGLTRRGRHSFVAGEVTDMDRAACGRHSFVGGEVTDMNRATDSKPFGPLWMPEKGGVAYHVWIAMP